MKSYFKYHKEQTEKKELKIDKMKPIERLDYFNRVDRIEEAYSRYCCTVFAMVFGLSTVILFMFGMILVSLETTVGTTIGLMALSYLSFPACLGIVFTAVGMGEVIIKDHYKNKQLNKLDEKYNL